MAFCRWQDTPKVLLEDAVDKGAKVVLFQSLVNLATEKVATYLDIAP